MSYLIAKGRRTALKISPPKNPRKFTGVAIRKHWQSSAARGHRIASALATADADPAFSAPFCGLRYLRRFLAVSPGAPGSRAPGSGARPGRRGSGGESAGITTQAAPSETEGAVGDAGRHKSQRKPLSADGRRESRHGLPTRGPGCPRRRFGYFFAVEKVPRPEAKPPLPLGDENHPING